MSDESREESKEMDSDLKEYLACFKSNTGRRQLPMPKTTSPSKVRMHKSRTKTVENLSFEKSLTSSEEDSLSEDSLLHSTILPHKKFNLKDINDLETSHTTSEDDVISSPTGAGQDDDTASAVGKLVLSLKELGSVSEDTPLSIASEDVTTSSFNVNANVFTVDELAAASDTGSTPANDKYSVTDNAKSIGVDDTCSEVTSYKDDFEEEEDENTVVEESLVSESIKELISSGITEIQPSVSYSDELTSDTISSSPNVNEDSIVSEREETLTSQHSSASKDTNTSTENNPSKHEVGIQTDPSWKVLSQLGTVNNILLEGHKTCSEAETMAFHNLVTQQLHLTRSLIETTRSLHHSQTLAIRPDYHYVTLEDTKQFIEAHKPRVLKMKKK